ncbi:hypothetical protein RRG08_007439 [Elysia crispata]|uniref:Uncharacterized protein n=1 Tax=Elysia crispata TaxID=231223 RepID=A0AAE1E1K8_9GAST|nr:hypothetical protein RRG08_007439 [Elysia crispata]
MPASWVNISGVILCPNSGSTTKIVSGLTKQSPRQKFALPQHGHGRSVGAVMVQSPPRDCFYDVLCRTRLHARKLAVSRESPELAEVTTRELRNLRVEETLDGRGKSYITHGGSCANFGGCEAFCRSNYDVESKGGRSLQEVTVAGNWFTRQHATFARAPLPGVIGHVTAIRPWPLKGDNPGGEMSGLELSFLFVSPLEIAGGLTQYTQPSCVPESHGLHRLSR